MGRILSPLKEQNVYVICSMRFIRALYGYSDNKLHRLFDDPFTDPSTAIKTDSYDHKILYSNN